MRNLTVPAALEALWSTGCRCHGLASQRPQRDGGAELGVFLRLEDHGLIQLELVVHEGTDVIGDVTNRDPPA